MNIQRHATRRNRPCAKPALRIQLGCSSGQLGSYRNVPENITYTLDTSNPDQSILGTTLITDGIDHMVRQGLFDAPPTDNPIGFFRIQFTAGSKGHDITMSSDFFSSFVSSFGIPAAATSASLPIALHVVPAPPAFILTLCSFAIGVRRKRAFLPDRIN